MLTEINNQPQVTEMRPTVDFRLTSQRINPHLFHLASILIGESDISLYKRHMRLFKRIDKKSKFIHL